MKVKTTITHSATLENLPLFLEKVVACARGQGIRAKGISAIELSMEEVLVNIITHAYKDRPEAIKVICGLDEGLGFVIQVIDTGKPFDVAGVDRPDVEAGIDQRKVGGLGLFLVQQLMDDVQYRREANRNIWTLMLNQKRGPQRA